MSKSPYVLPEEYKKKAIANNINLNTVYKRIQRGWTYEKACTKPARKAPIHVLRNDRVEGMLQTVRPKGKQKTFSYYKDQEEELNAAVEESGLGMSDFVCMCIEEYLNNRSKSKTRGKTRSKTRGKTNDTKR